MASLRHGCSSRVYIVIISVLVLLMLAELHGVEAGKRPPNARRRRTTIAADRPTTLKYRLVEEQPAGTVVGDLLTDAGLAATLTREQLEQLQLDVLSGTHREYFAVEPNTGLLLVAKSIDRDHVCSSVQPTCRLRLDVALVRPLALFHAFQIEIDVLDINDNDPVFNPSSVTLTIPESVPIGTFYVLPQAEDVDGEPYSVVSYEFFVTSSADVTGSDVTSNDSDAPFKLQINVMDDGSTELRLVITDRLDRETVDRYESRLVAYDGGPTRRSATLAVFIVVSDTNDNAPKFEQASYSVTVPEDFPVSTPILQLRATDADEGQNAQVRYSFARHGAPRGSSDQFTIDGVTGAISLLQRLDYERDRSHSLLAVAFDAGPGSMTSYARVVVHVTDVNDHAPYIRVHGTPTGSAEEDGFEAAIFENEPPGSFVVQISVTDQDSEENGRCECTLEAFQPDISTSSTSSSLNPSTSVEDNLGLMTSSDSSISNISNAETAAAAAAGSESGEFTSDAFAEKPQSKSSPLELFRLTRVHRTMYKLVTEAVLDREERDAYRLTLVCRDSGRPAPLESRVALTVRVDDRNDNAPVFASPPNQQPFTATVLESAPIGTLVLRVSATDRDVGPNADVVYRIVDDGSASAVARLLRIDNATGSIFTSGELDYEKRKQLDAVVVATDRGTPALSSSSVVCVVLADVNDEPPRFGRPEYVFEVSENQPAGTEVGFLDAVDADSPPYNRFRFTLVDLANSTATDLFEVDRFTGKISTQRELDREECSVHRMKVVVRDDHPPHSTSTANVVVTVSDQNDNDPSIDVDSLTFDVAAESPAGHAFGIISASDADIGLNAKLDWSIVKGDEERRFDVNPSTGVLSIARADLAWTAVDRYQLAILVRDRGSPPRSTVAVVDVRLVNRTGGIVNQRQSEQLTTSQRAGTGSSSWFTAFPSWSMQMIAVVVVAATSGLLIIFLLTLIVCCLRHSRKSSALRQRRRTTDLVCPSPHHDVSSTLQRQAAASPASRRLLFGAESASGPTTGNWTQDETKSCDEEEGGRRPTDTFPSGNAGGSAGKAQRYHSGCSGADVMPMLPGLEPDRSERISTYMTFQDDNMSGLYAFDWYDDVTTMPNHVTHDENEVQRLLELLRRDSAVDISTSASCKRDAQQLNDLNYQSSTIAAAGRKGTPERHPYNGVSPHRDSPASRYQSNSLKATDRHLLQQQQQRDRYHQPNQKCFRTFSPNIPVENGCVKSTPNKTAPTNGAARLFKDVPGPAGSRQELDLSAIRPIAV